MRIIHYFLGFPPYRTGGMTKYAVDLMNEQIKDGNEIYALWPGKINFFSKGVRIRKCKKISNIHNFELINPLPVPLDEGIKDVDIYIQSCDINVYQDFLEIIKPNVIHIHTLMGLHQEFIEAARFLKIRMIFTTHDYFGICPKVTLYKNGCACDDDHGCAECIQCNTTALSLKKIKIMQSPLYRTLKNTLFFRYMRKKHREKFFEKRNYLEIPHVDEDNHFERYKILRTYYLDSLKRIDLIHFNSSLTEKIYKRYFTPKESKVISITHKDIYDNRNTNSWEYKEKLSITCLAPAKPFKGFDVLKKTLDQLWSEGNHKFELKIYSPVDNPSPYMIIHENGYTYENLGKILSETDVLVALSIWYETFGFTVLEAISYGVPVIVSDHVGAKDIIGRGGILVEAGNISELKNTILDFTKEKQIKLRNNIKKNVSIKTWKTLVDETYQLY